MSFIWDGRTSSCLSYHSLSAWQVSFEKKRIYSREVLKFQVSKNSITPGNLSPHSSLFFNIFAFPLLWNSIHHLSISAQNLSGTLLLFSSLAHKTCMIESTIFFTFFHYVCMLLRTS